MYTAPPPPLSIDEIPELAKSATCDVRTAGRCWGMGITASYAAANDGTFPVRVVRIGRKLRVPTADLLASLGISPVVDDGPDAA